MKVLLLAGLITLPVMVPVALTQHLRLNEALSIWIVVTVCTGCIWSLRYYGRD